MTTPIVEQHGNITVVRDDLFLGGTKARFLTKLFANADEVVYASPAEGGAQTALAYAAKATGKRATIFVAARKTPHARAYAAKRIGAQVIEVRPGYLTVVQARARAYCERFGVTLAPFGVDMPEARQVISAAARSLALSPDEVWCASGSGVLMRSLALAWPDAARHAVQVGRALSASDVAGARIHIAPEAFSKATKARTPFPSDPHYDAKAWTICLQHSRARPDKSFLFWNVTGPAECEAVSGNLQRKVELSGERSVGIGGDSVGVFA